MSDWTGFGDPMLAAAALDRLLHRGVIVAIEGPSYRARKRGEPAGRRPPLLAI